MSNNKLQNSSNSYLIKKVKKKFERIESEIYNNKKSSLLRKIKINIKLYIIYHKMINRIKKNI